MSADTTLERKTRLEPATTDSDLRPWHKSETQAGCHLYWMPFTSPASFMQRRWALEFFRRFRPAVCEKTGTAANLFLQMKVIYPELSDSFIRTSPEFMPVTGLSRRPGAPLPALPDAAYIERLQKGKETYDHKGMQPDYSYWFLKDETEQQEALFFGFGGLTTIFAKVEESGLPKQRPTIPPALSKHPQFAPLLADNAVEKMMSSLERLASPFFPRSKKIFGKGLEDDLSYRGLKFIVPLLSTESFREATPDDIEDWFTLFDVIVTESPQDKGLLLASREDLDLDEMLSSVIDAMKAEGQTYPEYL